MAWLRLVEQLVAASVASGCLEGSGAAPSWAEVLR